MESVPLLTNRQKAIIIGTLLGDGYLTSNGSLQVEQKDRPYVEWKYEELRGIAGKPPRFILRFDKRTGKNTFAWRFYTRTVLKEYRECFYPQGARVVPCNIKDLLTDSLALATWYMDDGGRGGNTPKGMIFTVSGYSSEDQRRLKNCLKTNFGIEITIHANRDLYVPANQAEKFAELVRPHIIPVMRYKIPFDPVTTDS